MKMSSETVGVLDQVRVTPSNNKPGVRKITFRFRWPCVIEQTRDGQTVACLIPCGEPGAPVLHPMFVEHFQLSDMEREKAENSVFRAVALLPE